jgi:hypothetical protein
MRHRKQNIGKKKRMTIAMITMKLSTVVKVWTPEAIRGERLHRPTVRDVQFLMISSAIASSIRPLLSPREVQCCRNRSKDGGQNGGVESFETVRPETTSSFIVVQT